LADATSPCRIETGRGGGVAQSGAWTKKPSAAAVPRVDGSEIFDAHSQLQE